MIKFLNQNYSKKKYLLDFSVLYLWRSPNIKFETLGGKEKEGGGVRQGL